MYNQLITLLKKALLLGHLSGNETYVEAIFKIYKTFLNDIVKGKNHSEALESSIQQLKNHTLDLQNQLPVEKKKLSELNDCLQAFFSQCQKTRHNINTDDLSSLNFKPEQPLHHLINRKHLQENGKLLSDESIQFAINTLSPGNPTIFINGYRVQLIENSIHVFYKELGNGSFGSVYLSQNIMDGEFYAVKKFKNEVFANEKIILEKLNIYKGTFVSKNFHLISMKLAPGVPLMQLYQHLIDDTEPHIIESTYAWLKRFIAIAEAVNQLHEQNIIHGDLSLNNILIDAENNVTLVDFGFSTTLNHSEFDRKNIIGKNLKLILRKIAPLQKYLSTDYAFKAEEIHLASLLGAFIGADVDEDNNIKLSSARSNIVMPRQTLDAILLAINKLTKSAHHLNEFITDLKIIQADLLEILANFKHIGIVNVEEIISQANNKIMNNFIAPLKLFDRVILINHSMRNADLKSLMLRLKKFGIPVAGVYSTEGKLDHSIITQLLDVLDKQNNQHNIEHYFYVTEKTLKNPSPELSVLKVEHHKKLSDYKNFIINEPLITFNQLMMIRNSLHDEINRIKLRYQKALANPKKHADTAAIITLRMNTIEKTLSTLEINFAKDKLSWKDTKIILANLENAMTHVNSLKGFFCSLFGLLHHTKGQKAIRKIPEQFKHKEIALKLT